MSGVTVWNVICVTISIYFLYNNFHNGIDAFEIMQSESEIHDSFERPQIWSTLLEEMTIK